MANSIVKLGAGITVLVTITTAILLPTPDESSDFAEYKQRCTLAHAFHDSYLPVAAKKAKLPSMFFTDGEALRPQWVAIENSKRGIGIVNSLHVKGLARDKYLFVAGKYSDSPKDYVLAGVIWEAIGPSFGVKTYWGGRFSTIDAVHFSCGYQGVK
jgi:hypothetical protein